jgi:uncharacterized protein (TIGR02246 family)
VSASRSALSPATAPEELHAALEDAFGRGDLDAFVALHAPDATVAVPPEGRVAGGLDAIRAATAPFVSMRPRLTSTVFRKVEGETFALTHARWELVGTGDDGAPVELSGRGTLVSRREADGTWRIILDDPLTPVTTE